MYLLQEDKEKEKKITNLISSESIKSYNSSDVFVENMKELKVFDKYNQLNENSYSFLTNMQKELFSAAKNQYNGIKLVAFDTSGTLIKYKTSEKTQQRAAQKIQKFLLENKIIITEKRIIDGIAIGFKEYDAFRKMEDKEYDELEMYKRYIFPEISRNILNILNKEQLYKIIEYWKIYSVDISLNSKKIFDIVKSLKEKNIMVVTISDMLGDMTLYALKELGIYSIFDAHFVSNDFKVRKRNTEHSLFDIANQVCQVSPSNSLMIGNDFDDDIVMSKKKGWHNIFITQMNSYNSKNNKNFDKIIAKVDDLIVSEILINNGIVDFFKTNIAQRIDSDRSQVDYYIRNIAKGICNRELRTKIYNEYLLLKCGSKTRIGFNFEVRYSNRIIIGDNCQINDNVTILNEGWVIIGNNVMIALGVFISTYWHDWRVGMLQEKTESWAKGNTEVGTVSIGGNCWIGPYVCFEADVYLGENCVVAANSLVKSGIYPAYSFIAGNPAKIVRNIEKNIIDVKKSYVFEG